MIVIGGSTPGSDDAGDIPDVWPQGLGVFDLSLMEWKDHYDAAAAPYVTPQVVRTYYAQNGLYPSSWDDPVVETWFTGKCKSLLILHDFSEH